MKSFQDLSEADRVVELKKLGLTETEAGLAAKGKKQKVEITESHKPSRAVQLTEAQQVQLEEIGKHLADWKIKKPLVRAYMAMGLTAQESYIAAGVETRLKSMSEVDFSKFEF